MWEIPLRLTSIAPLISIYDDATVTTRLGVTKITPGFDTFDTVAVRKAMEDQVQAQFSAKTSPADAIAAAQKAADELLCPLCRADRAQARVKRRQTSSRTVDS